MKSKTQLIKEKHSFGEVHLYYKNDKLVKKIDYTRSPPWQYTYENDTVNVKVIKPKFNKKLWFGTIGTLLILASLYTAYKINNKYRVHKINPTIIQKTIE